MSRFKFSFLTCSGLVVIFAVGMFRVPVSSNVSFQKNDIPFSTEVETPHVPWAKKLPGGPIQGFFIPSVTHGRDMVELMQRLSINPVTVTIDRSWDVNCWGIGDYYGHETRGDIDDFQMVYSYVEKELTGNQRFEVLLIPGLNGWSRMTRSTRDAILRRVSDGAGLVLLHPFVGDVKGHPFKGDEKDGDLRIWELSALVDCPDDYVTDRGYPELNSEVITKGKWRVLKRHYITEGVPLELIPSGLLGGRFYKYRPAGDVLIEADGYPIVAVKQYGKGRVASLAYVEEGFVPESVDPVETGIYWDYWEYHYSLLARCVAWAAARDGNVGISFLNATPEKNSDIQLALNMRSATRLEIETTARSEFGPLLGKHKSVVELPAGEQQLAIPAASFRPSAGWPAGRQIIDVILRDASTGATLNWASATFQVPKRAHVTGISPNAEAYHEGDVMSVVARAAGDLQDLRLRLQVTDDLQRVVFIEEKPARGEKHFYCPMPDFVGKYASVTAELLDPQGTVVDQLRHKPLLVVPRMRREKEYEAKLPFEAPRHYYNSLRQSLLHAAAIDSGFTWGGTLNNDLDMPRGYFGVYWYDRGPTTPEGLKTAIEAYQKTGDFESLQYLTKKELYRRTGDKKYLTRFPCLDDPQVLDLLSNTSRTVARNKAMYNMDYFFVGDEGSLTSYTDPYDFCWGPHTLANFRLWLKKTYGTLEELNGVWKSNFSNWDAVVPATTEEAMKSRSYAPWADHRTYMEISFANAYRVVREGVRQGDPEGRIALSGTQVTTAYNGCDWYRLDQIIDDFLSYGGGNQWDFHRSFAKPGAMVGFWTGYGSSGPGVRNQIWTAALNNVLYPNLFWSPSIVNPDFTFSKSARDMSEVFRVLRFDGIGKLLMEADRVSDGISLHYSIGSVHAATILGIHPKNDEEMTGFPANREGWVKALSDLGLAYDFLSYEQLEKGILKPGHQRVLILPLSMALSSAEAQALKLFAEGGGVVIADAAAGLMDEHCAWQESGILNEFFGITTAPSSQRDVSAVGDSGEVTLTSEGKAWKIGSGELTQLSALETGITGVGAQPLIRVGNSGAAFVRRVGKGWAIYLNVRFSPYPALRTKGFQGGGYRALLSGILGHLGVRPTLEILDVNGQPLGQATIARYRFGDGEVLAVVKDNEAIEGNIGKDGVTTFNDAKLGKLVRQMVTVKLPKRWHVTDLRSGQDLGQTDRVQTSVVAGDALILGLSSVRPSVNVQGESKAQRGDHPLFKVIVSGSGKRLLRCHFFAPDGRFLADYARNILLEEGQGQVILPSAHNDPKGAYRLKVTDVLTGASGERTIELQ